MEHNQSRRRFVGNLLTMAGGSAAVPLAINLAVMGEAAAENATDYKAIICLFLAGGNDHYNTVLAMDNEEWGYYSAQRSTGGSGSIMLDKLSLLKLPSTGSDNGVRSFGLNPNLTALHGLYGNNRAAIVANVGTLLQPIANKDVYKADRSLAPPKLFSHNDQQSMWQSLKPEGANFGWGGKLADAKHDSNSDHKFTCVSASGNTVFLAGAITTPYQVSSQGAVAISSLKSNFFDMNVVAGTPSMVKDTITAARDNPIENEHAQIVARSIAAQQALSTNMLPAGAGGVPNPTQYKLPKVKPSDADTWAPNPLAIQLQSVARIIGGRTNLGVKRQVFFVSLPGFDTHDNQRIDHADLMAKLDHALAYFDSTMRAFPGSGDISSQVTLFTASDFGRTLSSNGDGSDHGWGAHHFVVGGAVYGGKIYGEVPLVALNNAWDVGSGALLPTTSVEQYAATLATWFGLDGAQIATVFPRLAGFSKPDLGFMKPA